MDILILSAEVHTRTVILHRDDRRALCQSGTDDNMHGCMRTCAETVLYGVFYNRLQGQRRQTEGRMRRVKIHIQTFTVAERLHRKIGFGMTKLLMKRDGLGRGNRGEIVLQISGEVLNDLHGKLWIILTQHVDRRQCVIDEMRTDLLDHAVDLCRAEFHFLLPEKALVQNGGADKTETENKEIGNNPQHEERRCVERAFTGENQKINAERQQERQTPEKLALRGSLLEQHNKMQDGGCDAVSDQNLMQLDTVEKLEDDQDKSAGEKQTVTDIADPAVSALTQIQQKAKRETLKL